MIRRFFSVLSLWVCLALLQPVTFLSAQAPAAKPTQTADTAGLAQTLGGFVKAYNEHNAQAIGALFTDDAVIIDAEGIATRGKAAITEQFTTGFATPSPFKLEAAAESTRFITAEVAQVEGTSKLTAVNETPISNRFSILVVKKAAGWQIAEIRDTPVASEEVPPADRLAELEWMVGEWMDESPEAAISSTITWGDNKAFLIRKYSVTVAGKKESGGMMIIGWDPAAMQIKSWVFDGAGGHAEGHWTRASENQWVIKARGTLSDGSPTSATQYVTIVTEDSVKTGSFDQVIAGEVSSEAVETLMVRKPPVPATSATPAAK